MVTNLFMKVIVEYLELGHSYITEICSYPTFAITNYMGDNIIIDA